jgi:hypothetical protein
MGAAFASLRAVGPALALAVLLLTGCGGDSGRVEKFRQVKPGWTKEQVTSLLGKPDALQDAGLGLAEVWEYKVKDWKGKEVSTFTIAILAGRVMTGSLKVTEQ